MINILIISDNHSINKLIDHFQPLLLGRFDLAHNFEQGLKMVFIKHPVAVFIQSELAGISGETVSRHIKALLGDKSPNIILLSDNPSVKASKETFSDDSLDLFLPDNQLIEAFRLQLDKIPGLLWKEPLHVVTETDSAVNARKTVPSVEKSEVTPLVDVEPPYMQAAWPHNASHREEREDVPGLPALEKVGIDSNAKIGASSATGGKHPVVVQKNTSAAPFEPGIFDKVEQNFNFRRNQNRRQWLYFLALFIAVGLGMLIYLNYSRVIAVSQQRKPAVSAKAPGHSAPIDTGQAQTAFSGQAINGIHLPSFIPPRSIDAAYSQMHPGWARYYDQQREFLVFSKKGVIKAVQVIAREEGGINSDFFSSALKELCGVETLKVTTRREKGGYGVEEGKVGDTLDFILYKKLNTGKVVAFVVALSR
ncbi:MAG: hypothetical protein WA140_07730 [Geobacteraceae bacterium]